MSVLFWAFFLTTLAFVHNSDALKCYECTGGDKCDDPFSKSGINTENCDGSCMKVKGEGDGVKATVRACFPSKQSDGCTEVEKAGNKGDVCYCNSDLCNTGSKQLISLPLILAIGGFVTMAKYVMIR